MNDLILVREENGKQLVSARELYEFLEVDSNFTTWAKRMFEYGFTQNVDYSICIPFQESKEKRGGHNAKDYALTIDCAKEISMLQRSDKGKQARLYFIECEKKLKNLAQLPNFLDPAESAIAWAEQYKGRVLAEQKVKELKPKGEAYDAFMEYEGFFNLKQVADLFNIPGIGRSKFMNMLRNDGILTKNNEPYRTDIDNGRFKTCLQDGKGLKVNGGLLPRYNTLISAKGVDYLFNRYKHLILDIEGFNKRKMQLISKK